MIKKFFKKMENITPVKEIHPLLKELSEKQQNAVLSQNNRLLVLAGAGSGKTKTLIQRIIYLMFESQVKKYPCNHIYKKRSK